MARIRLWPSMYYQYIGEYLEQDLELILSGQNSDRITNPEAFSLHLWFASHARAPAFLGL